MCKSTGFRLPIPTAKHRSFTNLIYNDIQNDNNEDSSKNENRNEDRNDIIQKLVEMFERQTERIILLENSINPRNQSKCS